jgi:hypothetical protein
MSRMVPALFALVGAAMPVSAFSQNDTVTVEEAMARSREMIAVSDGRCAPNEMTDEIVVCARQRLAPRLPLPAERGPRDGPRRATGEIPAASAAPMRSGSCGVRVQDRCGGGLPVLPILAKTIEFAGKVAGAILDPEE